MTIASRTVPPLDKSTDPHEKTPENNRSTRPETEQQTSAAGEIARWGRGYVDRHPAESMRTVGSQFVLGVRALQFLFIDIFRGRFPFKEFIAQSAFMINAAYLPTIAVAIPISATLSIQFGLLAGQVGAESLAGAASGLAVIRQAAPLVTAILMAAAVGSAICSDLGSRRIRDEIDAMEVMGVSVLRRLVVPRLAASMIVAMGLTGMSCFIGFLSGYMFNVFVQNGTPGSFLATFSSFAAVGDLYLAMGKALVFGAIVAVVACQKGLATKGGPGGVANSVNATVVASILILMVVNVAFTQFYEILFPRTSI